MMVLAFVAILKVNDWIPMLAPADVPIQQIQLAEGLDRVENGIHLASGLIADKGYNLVAATCGSCHSTKLVTQNRATKDGWRDMIRWMQKTQKLWDLGLNEEIILDYLAKNYPPVESGRRKNIINIKWYEL